MLRQALDIFERLGAAEVPGLIAEIASLPGQPPAR
jgi:hypothetical protein